MSKKIKTIIIALVVIILCYLAYIYLIKSNPADTSSAGSLTSANGSVGDTTSINSQIAEDTAFLSTLLKLNSIKIDPTLLASPAFNSLTDNTVEIVDDGIVGRVNPFLPFEDLTKAQQAQVTEENIVIPITNGTTPPKKP